MKELEVFKAQGTGEEEIEEIHIIFNKTIPDFESVGETDYIFKRDSLNLEHFLYVTLPGGTYEMLLIEMLSRKRNQLVVPLKKEKDGIIFCNNCLCANPEDRETCSECGEPL